jgi:hypothetical protein
VLERNLRLLFESKFSLVSLVAQKLVANIMTIGIESSSFHVLPRTKNELVSTLYYML